MRRNEGVFFGVTIALAMFLTGVVHHTASQLEVVQPDPCMEEVFSVRQACIHKVDAMQKDGAPKEEIEKELDIANEKVRAIYRRYGRVMPTETQDEANR